MDRISSTVDGAARLTRAVLPSRLPVYLGVSALLVVGAVDAPAAVAGGLAYEALRRWAPLRDDGLTST